jgi:hypothetical protein
LTAEDWTAIIALVAVVTGTGFSLRSLVISTFNQTEAALLSMKSQLSDTTAALINNLQTIAQTIRMTKNAPYTFTSEVTDGTTTTEYPGLLWITPMVVNDVSVSQQRVTLAAYTRAHQCALQAISQVSIADAQYRSLVERARDTPSEFLATQRDALASIAPVLAQLNEGSLNWTPEKEDIDVLGDAGLGVPDNNVTKLLEAIGIDATGPDDIFSRHRWARQMLVEWFENLANDALRQSTEALLLAPRKSRVDQTAKVWIATQPSRRRAP